MYLKNMVKRFLPENWRQFRGDYKKAAKNGKTKEFAELIGLSQSRVRYLVTSKKRNKKPKWLDNAFEYGRLLRESKGQTPFDVLKDYKGRLATFIRISESFICPLLSELPLLSKTGEQKYKFPASGDEFVFSAYREKNKIPAAYMFAIVTRMLIEGDEWNEYHFYTTENPCESWYRKPRIVYDPSNPEMSKQVQIPLPVAERLKRTTKRKSSPKKKSNSK